MSTTAIVRNWLDDGGSMSDISWKNGSANHVGAATGGEPVANTLTDGAGDELKNLTAYGTCVALTQGSGPAAHKLYVKSEYDSGNIVTGTHYNGYTWGMSVFIIGYKSYLYIDVGNVKEDNDGDGAGNPIFEIDQRRVDREIYHLKYPYRGDRGYDSVLHDQFEADRYGSKGIRHRGR